VFSGGAPLDIQTIAERHVQFHDVLDDHRNRYIVHPKI
jgi:hypothetical protein